MSEPGIDEDFNGAAPDARLQWWNAPVRAEVRDSLLTVVTRGGTDFWQRTHYGFRRDDGHCLLYEWSGGTSCSPRVSVATPPTNTIRQGSSSASRPTAG